MNTIDMLMRRAAKEPSACLMLLPDAKSAKAINNLKHGLELPPGTMLPDDGEKGPHVTIRFWKTDGRHVDQSMKDFLAQYLDGQVVQAKTTAWEIFGKKRDTLVLVVDSPELTSLQRQIDQHLQRRFDVPRSDFDDYRPHISVAEGLVGTEALPGQSPALDLRLNRWSLTEGHGDGYDEVWSLRAAKWVRNNLRTHLPLHRK